jgi:group I intron endonuclease
MMTIYKIVNLVNGKMYIGQTKYSLQKRMSGHLSDSKRTNTKLSNAINKYGIENFTISEIVKGDFNREFTDYLECHYIQLYATTLQYNIKMGGNSVPMTEDTRKKISENNKGTKMPTRLKYKDKERYSVEKYEIIKKKRSESHLGARNINSKKVIDNNTNFVYDCIKDAAQANNMHWKTLSKKLNNKTKNNTSLSWFDGTDLKMRIGGVTKTFTLI